jgi:carbon storage regulator
MLVLSRKIGESIQIAGDIRVTVTDVRGGRVRLSIEAPSSIRVLRKEIADTAMLSELATSQSGPSSR